MRGHEYRIFSVGQVTRPKVKEVSVSTPWIPKAEAAEPLTFATKLPTKQIVIAKPTQAEEKGPLDKACDTHAPGDSKCACVLNEIFKHDSSWATAGVGKRANNPCNMRIPATWTPAVGKPKKEYSVNGVFAKFATLEDGISACTELYARRYQDLLPEKLVSVWTDGGGNGAYRSSVKSCYD